MVALMLLLAQAVVEPAPAPSPTPQRAPAVVVERLLDLGNEKRRVSLFDNRVAVVSVRVDGNQILVRQLTLEEGEYGVYLAALAAAQSREEPAGSSLQTVEQGPCGVITIDLPGQAQQRLEYGDREMTDLNTARLLATVDDLERRVMDSNPVEEELRAWQPRVGDRVELEGGSTATVERVIEGGLIVVAEEGSPLLELIPPEQRPRRIRRLLEKTE